MCRTNASLPPRYTVYLFLWLLVLFVKHSYADGKGMVQRECQFRFMCNLLLKLKEIGFPGESSQLW